jgi:hypothetical protein
MRGGRPGRLEVAYLQVMAEWLRPALRGARPGVVRWLGRERELMNYGSRSRGDPKFSLSWQQLGLVWHAIAVGYLGSESGRWCGSAKIG